MRRSGGCTAAQRLCSGGKTGRGRWGLWWRLWRGVRVPGVRSKWLKRAGPGILACVRARDGSSDCSRDPCGERGTRNGLEMQLALGATRLEGEGAGVAGGWTCGGRMVHGAEGRAGLSCVDGSASGRHGEEDGPARWGRHASGGARMTECAGPRCWAGSGKSWAACGGAGPGREGSGQRWLIGPRGREGGDGPRWWERRTGRGREKRA